jgi:hypothetical protein
VLRIAREWVLESMARHGPVTAWILDETAFCKMRIPAKLNSQIRPW